MSIGSILLLLLVAGVCGSVGRFIAGARRGGCLASIGLGFIGALLGMYVAHWLKLPEWFTVHVGGQAFPVVWSIVGSALFVAVLGIFSRRRD